MRWRSLASRVASFLGMRESERELQHALKQLSGALWRRLKVRREGGHISSCPDQELPRVRLDAWRGTWLERVTLAHHHRQCPWLASKFWSKPNEQSRRSRYRSVRREQNLVQMGSDQEDGVLARNAWHLLSPWCARPLYAALCPLS